MHPHQISRPRFFCFTCHSNLTTNDFSDFYFVSGDQQQHAFQATEGRTTSLERHVEGQAKDDKIQIRDDKDQTRGSDKNQTKGNQSQMNNNRRRHSESLYDATTRNTFENKVNQKQNNLAMELLRRKHLEFEIEQDMKAQQFSENVASRNRRMTTGELEMMRKKGIQDKATRRQTFAGESEQFERPRAMSEGKAVKSTTSLQKVKLPKIDDEDETDSDEQNRTSNETSDQVTNEHEDLLKAPSQHSR